MAAANDGVAPTGRPAWLDDSFKLVENRPWANELNRKKNGCLGTDFVFDDPKVILRFYWSEALQRLEGTATFTMRAEGPPTGAHGASTLLVFDEILAYPVWVTGVTALTLSLSTRLKKMTPLGCTLRFEAFVAKKEGRKRFLAGRLLSLDGREVYAEADGLWYVTDKVDFHGHTKSML